MVIVVSRPPVAGGKQSNHMVIENLLYFLEVHLILLLLKKNPFVTLVLKFIIKALMPAIYFLIIYQWPL